MLHTTRPSELLKMHYTEARILHYTEAPMDRELCYYYYITMDELLNPDTDERIVLCVCTIPV